MKELIYCISCEKWVEYYKMVDDEGNNVCECVECERQY